MVTQSDSPPALYSSFTCVTPGFSPLYHVTGDEAPAQRMSPSVGVFNVRNPLASNTVKYRLKKVADLTSLDPSDLDDVLTLKISLMVRSLDPDGFDLSVGSPASDRSP